MSTLDRPYLRIAAVMVGTSAGAGTGLGLGLGLGGEPKP